MNKIEKIIKKSYSRSEICRKLGYHTNGAGIKKVNKLIEEYNADISHFNYHITTTKYKTINKVCPVCGKMFKAKEGHVREKTTCSYSCSNTYFRSGENNPNYKNDPGKRTYRNKAIKKYGCVCMLCGFDKEYAIQVHHKDHNRENNKLKNLIVLCANCHLGIHREKIKL